MTNPYQAAQTSDTIESSSGSGYQPPQSVWKLVGAGVMWCLTGVVFLTIGWPFAIAYAFFWNNNRERLAERESLEADVRPCPSCGRQLGGASIICPKCGHRFR